MRLLVLNAGSSTLKAATYQSNRGTFELLASLHTPWTSSLSGSTLRYEARGKPVIELPLSGSVDKLIDESLTLLSDSGPFDAVAHRVVHGGTLRASQRWSESVQRELERVTEFAPLHNPIALQVLAATQQRCGDTTHVCVFDTAYYQSMPPDSYSYAGPRHWVDAGWRRYGFHGISHRSMYRRACEHVGLAQGQTRALTCHLGNGCSITANHAGQALDTSMGFTPLEGMMMGTRSGSIDPGLLLYLLKSGSYKLSDLENELQTGSGLLGVSGISSDMRDIMTASQSGNQDAALAERMFIRSFQRAFGAMLGSLGGVELIVFSGGIGEHASTIRSRALSAFSFLGIALKEDDADEQGVRVISKPESSIPVVVVPADEQQELAREAIELLHGQVF